MAQNTSTAVMQRRSEPHDSLDDFPTPCWATRALCEWLEYEAKQDIRDMGCREPAANRGHMVRPLKEYFGAVYGSDIHDYGAGFPLKDFLWPDDKHSVEWTITNPPFRLAEQFIAEALKTSTHGVAVLVRLAFLEGVGRYQRLFNTNPPTNILQFSERVVMHKGKLSASGSTATAYCWLIWNRREFHLPTRFGWIAPCRKRLERPEDYEVLQ